MQARYFEVTNGYNWGKFAVMWWSTDDWRVQSTLEEQMGRSQSLLKGRGWSQEHVWVMDLQTGEAALLRRNGHAANDLEKHAIWVCPMFEPFLAWFYRENPDLVELPRNTSTLVELTEEEAPSAMAGYRRPGPEVEPESEYVEVGVRFRARPSRRARDRWVVMVAIWRALFSISSGDMVLTVDGESVPLRATHLGGPFRPTQEDFDAAQVPRRG